MASKRYSKKSTKRTIIKLSPKEADEIIRAEFIDGNKNKHILNINVKPHLPTREGDMKLKYKMNNSNTQGENE